MANPQYRLDEEEKKIIDLIRQHKLDYINVRSLFRVGAENFIKAFNTSGIEYELTISLQRDLDKYTKLLEYLEKGE